MPDEYGATTADDLNSGSRHTDSYETRDKAESTLRKALREMGWAAPNEVAVLRAELKAERERAKEIDDALGEQMHRADVAEAELAALRERCKNLDERCRSYADECLKRGDELTALRAERDRLRRKRDDARNQIKFGAVMAQQDYEEQVAALRAEARALEARVREVTSERNHVEQRCDKLDAKVDHMQPVVEAATALVDAPRVYLSADTNCHVADTRRADEVIAAFTDAVDAYREARDAS